MIAWVVGLVAEAGEVPSRFLRDPERGLVAVYVQVETEGWGPLWMQLDTAVPQVARLRGRTLDLAKPTRIEGTLGEHRFSGRAPVDAELGAVGDRSVLKAGNLGYAALDGVVLRIDPTRESVAVLETAPDGYCWAALQEPLDVPWVHVEDVGHALFDTASAPHGLWTNPRAFALLTGGPAAAAPTAGEGSAFGQPVQWRSAPATRTLRAGALSFEALEISVVEGRASPRRAGVLGLRGFEDRPVVLDRVAGRLGSPCR